MQSLVLFLCAFFAILFVVFYLKNNAGGGGSVGLAYAPAKTLFTPAERSFLGVLDEAVGNDYRVFGKVRVADYKKP